MTLSTTPSQTVGPFFGVGLSWPAGHQIALPDDPDAIEITGTVIDGDSEPVTDALVEIWQADRSGGFRHPAGIRPLPLGHEPVGFGRCATDRQGRYRFVTVKPGAVPRPDGVLQAPHLNISVFARGLLVRLFTRLYFPDEAEANASDPVLLSITDPARRETLVARPEAIGLAFDIRLQGERETVFFAL